MIKLLMVDDNVNLVKMVSEYFKNKDNISLEFVAHDGKEGIELIEEKQNEFDVLLLDLIMPKKDGLYVLEEMKKRGINKNVIVETSYNTQEVIKQVSDYNVNYFILKPFELDDLESRIMGISKRKDDTKTLDFYHNNLQVSITKILHELGIPSHIKGYQYIREGVSIIFERPETIGGITKELYPELASKFDSRKSYKTCNRSKLEQR